MKFRSTVIAARFALFCLAALLIAAPAFAKTGELVGFKRIATISEPDFNKRMNEVFGSASPAPLKGSLNLFKVTYRSKGVNGKNAILSGLVVLPDAGAPNGLIVFNHGTVVYTGNLPSRFTGKATGSESETAILAFASGGYAIAMPDYIGQGDHSGGHPYPASKVNARSGMDIIKTARTLAKRHGFNIGSPLFVTGYSEGGAVAMALVRELERSSDPLHNVTASAPAAGPYDLSGSTREFMLEQPTDQAGFVIRTYLLGNLVYFLHKSQGVKITNYLKPSMAFTINNAYGGRVKDADIIKRIGVTALLMQAKNNIHNVITPRFKRAIESLDVRDPAVRLLKDNDVHDWAPTTRMLLINLEGDDVVTPKNTQVAFQAMRRRGVGRDKLRRSIIRDTKLNHITAVPASMLRARSFFDGGFAAVRDIENN